MNFRSDRLDELSSLELFNILRLRSDVFVVEQHCVYADPDEWDAVALHIRGLESSSLLAYARILPPGTRFDEASIGRVLTASSARGRGYGKELMRWCVKETLIHFNVSSIRISAQCYLLDFYTGLGFVTVGAKYDEDGIPHQEMLYRHA